MPQGAGAAPAAGPAGTPAPDELLQRLRRFHSDYFPRHQQRFQDLVAQGQHPKTLFIGCSDSRLVPYLLTGAGPGELFIVRNVGALVPPYEGLAAEVAQAEGEPAGRLAGLHGTTAAIEFAVLSLQVERIVVCGHSHCGAIRAAYEGTPDEAIALKAWLRLAAEALLPVRPSPEALRRTEERAVVLQLERLMGYPMVRRRVEAGALTLHGWHYVIEDGEIHVFDAEQARFVPASLASNAGTGPYRQYVEHDGQILDE
jgi:carbonic anhydrase